MNTFSSHSPQVIVYEKERSRLWKELTWIISDACKKDDTCIMHYGVMQTSGKDLDIDFLLQELRKIGITRHSHPEFDAYCTYVERHYRIDKIHGIIEIMEQNNPNTTNVRTSSQVSRRKMIITGLLGSLIGKGFYSKWREGQSTK